MQDRNELAKPGGTRPDRRAVARHRRRQDRRGAAFGGVNGRVRLNAWQYEADTVLRVQAERLGMPWGTRQNRMSLCARLQMEQAAACGVERHVWANMTHKERASLRALIGAADAYGRVTR
jgi:hypothetical protein